MKMGFNLWFLILTSQRFFLEPKVCILCSVIPIKQVLEERPDMCLLAEFPSEGRLAYSLIIMIQAIRNCKILL